MPSPCCKQSSPPLARRLGHWPPRPKFTTRAKQRHGSRSWKQGWSKGRFLCTQKQLLCAEKAPLRPALQLLQAAEEGPSWSRAINVPFSRRSSLLIMTGVDRNRAKPSTRPRKQAKASTKSPDIKPQETTQSTWFECVTADPLHIRTPQADIGTPSQT